MLLKALRRTAAAACRARPEAFAAAGIGAATLVLALLAADGEGELPAVSSGAAPPFPTSVSPAREASDAAVDAETLAAAALAGRLVEDPAFDLAPPRDEQPAGGPTHSPPPAVKKGAADDEAYREENAQPLPAAKPGAGDLTSGLLERGQLASPSARQPKPAAAPQRAFAIQLMAVGRREQAERAWDRLRHDNLDLLGRLQPTIAAPEQKTGALFRLRAGPVASAEDGRALCAALSGRGVACIVVQGG